MRRPAISNFAWLLALGLLALTAPAMAAEAQALSASKAVAELGRELGVSIRLKGGQGRTAALSDAMGSPETRIARLTAELTGSWRRILRVSAAAPAKPPVSAELERSVTFGFSDLPASKALAIAARQIGAEWDPAGEPSRRVTLPGVARTVRELLDEIGRQAGVAWTLEYRIDAPDAEAIQALIRPEPPRPMPPTSRVEPAPEISVSVVPSIPTASVWSRSLKESVLRLLRASPDRRSAVLDEFLREMGNAAVFLQAVPIERRPAYRAAGSKLYEQWSRLYRGLAPTVRTELEPADVVMRDLLGG